MTTTSSFNENTTNGQDNGFICGVVEGFYGRPWTTEQRKELFRKLKRLGCNSYVYAPKDDVKHRLKWREMYTVEESEHLSGLIAAAKEHNVTFYYALSPGLDITYSSSKEVAILKRKLEQVSHFGCEAFALLFDDIESEMSKADKEVFQTFAGAQVSVTNEMYNQLNFQKKWLFCPTQYCQTRAQPDVTNSEYLNTVGTKLATDIDVLWTGPQVISKLLSVESIREITEVLRRPPVIWDNLHANDYDQKRVFLGPYAGRSPELIPLLRGVLTNPNCEYHANHVAIHTLAHWAKCSADTQVRNSMSADIKLESENEEGIYSEEAPACMSKNVYHPRLALKNAIIDWLPEFFVHKEAFGPISKPQPPVEIVMPVIPILPSINTCMSLTATTSTTTNSNIPEVNISQLQALAEVCSAVTGTEPLSTMPNLVMNSLVSATKVVTNDSLQNPIVSASISLPTFPVPISSLGIPLLTMKTNLNDIDTATPNVYESIDIEDYKLNDAKKDEPMPVEDLDDDAILQIAEQIEENIAEIDVEVDDSANAPEKCKNIAPSSNQHIFNSTGPEQMSADLDNNFMLAEPMECAPATNQMASPKHIIVNDVNMLESVSTSSAGSMQVESSDTSLNSNAEMHDIVDKIEEKDITVEDLNLLCDLFYLPFEHGARSLQIMNEFHWLKTNAAVLIHSYKKGQDLVTAKPEVQEWFQRSEKFHTICQSVIQLAKRIALCPNKELCHDLFAYVYDIAGAVILLCAFIKWLALATFPANMNSYIQGSYTWFSKGWRETFTSGDQEPWVFRGGIAADLQRLIPVDSGNDLFIYKSPETPTTNFYSIRPYTHLDEADVYNICHKTCRDGYDCSDLFPKHLQTIPADRLAGPFLTMTPELCFVVQGPSNELLGYACAALDAKVFYRGQEMCWLPAMCQKYPVSLLDASDLTPAAKDSINHFHNFKYDYPQEVLNTHPSILTCSVLQDHPLVDACMAKRLITVLLAALRSNNGSGMNGVHVCINSTDKNLNQFYNKLGFTDIYEDIVSCRVFLGRNF